MSYEHEHTRNIVVCVIAAVSTVALIIWFCLNSQGCQRMEKSISSDLGGGINRTVTLYDYQGDKLDSWNGTFDVSEDDQEVYFDLNGKRTIIEGGIVVVQENGSDFDGD